MKILVVGCGSIGRRHIRNLRSLGFDDVIAFDTAEERLRSCASDQQITAFGSLEEAFAQKPVLVMVCTPPHLHLEVAQLALTIDAHVFIEKPIASDLHGVDDLLAEARRRKRLVYVGYNLRFHSGLEKLKAMLDAGVIGKPLTIRAEAGQYLPDWRPTQDYRNGYIVSPATGGGILLDASHEIDYVRWLGGEIVRVYCAAGHLSTLEMHTEDTAAIITRMDNGMIGEVHLDCVQRGYAKNCKVIGTEGTLLWDFHEGVRWFSGTDKTWQRISIVPDTNEMYVREIRHVLQCLNGDSEPLVDGAAGRRVLEIVLAAKRSSEHGAEVVL